MASESGTPSAPPMGPEYYHLAHDIRRKVSTYHVATREWLRQWCSQRLQAAIGQDGTPKVFSVLSIGAGDGDVDFELITTMLKVAPADWSLQYMVIEPLHSHVEQCRARLGGIDDKRFECTVHEGTFGGKDGVVPSAAFDIAVMVQVMYYFEDRVPTVRDTARLLKPTGSVCAILHGNSGIAQIQREVSTLLRGADTLEHYTSETLMGELSAAGLVYEANELRCRVDVTETLSRTKEGMMLASFCMECELEGLSESTIAAVLSKFKEHAQPSADDTSMHIPETVHAICVTADAARVQ